MRAMVMRASLAVASSAGLNWHSTDTSALQKGVNRPEMVHIGILLCQNVTSEYQSSYDKKLAERCVEMADAVSLHSRRRVVTTGLQDSLPIKRLPA
jgi:hypothetical protein